MTKCPSTCRHRQFVTEYQSTRLADVERRDAAVGTYGADSTEYGEYQPPPITFKTWLQQMTGWGGNQGDDT